MLAISFKTAIDDRSDVPPHRPTRISSSLCNIRISSSLYPPKGGFLPTNSMICVPPYLKHQYVVVIQKIAACPLFLPKGLMSAPAVALITIKLRPRKLQHWPVPSSSPSKPSRLVRETGSERKSLGAPEGLCTRIRARCSRSVGVDSGW